MENVRVVRNGQGVSRPIFYPTMVDVPLSAYLLHEDGNRNFNESIDSQTNQILGSNHEIAEAIVYGFQQSYAQQQEQLILLRQLDGSLNRLEFQLSSIEGAIDRVADIVERAGAAIVRAVNQLHLDLTQLNASASLLVSMTERPELTWAREQATVASRAMTVGDLSVAETYIDYAIDGLGSHAGAPTQVDLLLLAAEIRIRQGGKHLITASEFMERARKYLALEPTSLLQARFQFAKGSLHLGIHTLSGRDDELKIAEIAFKEAQNDEFFASSAALYKAVVQTKRSKDPIEIATGLAKWIERRPQIAIEVLRLRGTKILASAADIAIESARTSLFSKFDRRAVIKERMREIGEAKKNVETTSGFDQSYKHNLSVLSDLQDLCKSYNAFAEKRSRSNSLMSAFLLKRDFNSFKQSYFATSLRLGK